MSQENVEIVKALFAAWVDRDPQAAMKHIDPSIKFDFTGASFLVQEADAHSGVAGMQALIASWLEAWGSLEWQPRTFIDEGDHVIVILRIVAQGRESGAPINRRVVVVYTLRDGLVVRFQGFDTLAAAANAVGV